MSMDINPFHEFFVQKNDKTLWYYNCMYGNFSIVPASDRLAPTVGHVEFDPQSLGTIEETPLDDYQATIEGLCQTARKKMQEDAWWANAQGRMDGDYTLEAMAFFLFEAPGSILLRVIEAAGVLLDVTITSEATTIGKVIEDAVAGWFFSRSIKQALNLSKDWVVEIYSQTSMKVVAALPSRTVPDTAPCFKRLDQIYAFRCQVDKPKFQETFNLLKKEPAIPFMRR